MERKAKRKQAKTDDVKKVKSKEKVTIKSYIRDFLMFVDKHIWKTTIILLLIALVIIALNLKSVGTLSDELRETYLSQTSFISRIQILGVTLLSGIVPYFYAPVVGFAGGVINDAVVLAYTVNEMGYIALLLGLVPLILNVFVICVITALGIYICRNITFSYRLSSLNNMNLLNFRIKVYEILGKENKKEALEAKKEAKMEKILSKKEKVNYLQVLNVSLVCLLLQAISSILSKILL